MDGLDSTGSGSQTDELQCKKREREMEKASPKVSVVCMEGGSGGDSYSHNSLLQNHNFHAFAKPHLSLALHHFAHRFFLRHLRHAISAHDHSPAHTPYLPASSRELADATPAGRSHVAQPRRDDADLPPPACNIAQLTVADFGCSHGRNTLDYAAFIMQTLYNKLKGNIAACTQPHGDSPPPSLEVEMQYFFSDLATNNFNALLQSLEPCFQEQIHCFDQGAAVPLTWKLFTAAVAGSFHGRLFPSHSLHLAISAYSLHWLSQVPPEVVDRASPAWNGGHIWIHGTRPKVVEAYARQFQKDIKRFLLNREKEMASGGMLFLFFPCRFEKYPQGAFFAPHHDIWTGCYESTWEGMVTEGLITKEERDIFNIPFYNCHQTEMQEALDKLSNKFKVVKMDVLRNCNNLPKEEEQKIEGDSQAFGKFVANFVASLMKPMVQAYLGESRANNLFQRLEGEATKKAYLSTSISYDMLIAVIERL